MLLPPPQFSISHTVNWSVATLWFSRLAMTYSIQNSKMGEGAEWQHVNIRVEREETVHCLQEGTWWHQAEEEIRPVRCSVSHRGYIILGN